MLRKLSILVMILLLCTSAVMFAAPLAEEKYGEIQSMDLSTMKMDRIINTYDDFYQRVEKIGRNALDDMASARKKGDIEAYREAYGRYTSLSEFTMTREESDRLLERILAEPQEDQNEYAAWLYHHSPYYRPTLTIDFSLEGDTYRYSYAQRVRQLPGTMITLPDENQLHVNSSQVGILSGWGIVPDSVTYEPGEEIPMPPTSQTLYAVWTKAVRFDDTLTGTTVVHEPVKEGEVVSVPQVAAPDPSYRFIGWYDRIGRQLLEGENEYQVKGNGALFEGLWKHLAIDAISPLYHGFDRLPTGTQIAVGFSLSNQGNLPLRNLKVSLNTGNEDVTMLCDTVSLGNLPAGSHRTNNSRYASSNQIPIGGEVNTFRFVIDKSVESGSSIPFTLTVTDGDGESWSSPVSFTVR